MSQDRGPQAKRTTKKLYTEQPLFELNDYVNNPALINKLHEDELKAIVENKTLKEQLEAISLSYHELKIQNKEFEINLNNTNAEINRLTKEKTEVLADVRILRDQLETARSLNHEMDLQKQRLELNLEEVKGRLRRNNWRAFYQLITAVLGTVIISIGVNLATSRENISLGWGMIGMGVILQIVAFFIGFSRK